MKQTNEARRNGRLPELDLVTLDAPEVGEPVDLDLPDGQTMRATWLGTVSNGKELAQAMRLMWAMAEEREAAG